MELNIKLNDAGPMELIKLFRVVRKIKSVEKTPEFLEMFYDRILDSVKSGMKTEVIGDFFYQEMHDENMVIDTKLQEKFFTMIYEKDCPGIFINLYYPDGFWTKRDWDEREQVFVDKICSLFLPPSVQIDEFRMRHVIRASAKKDGHNTQLFFFMLFNTHTDLGKITVDEARYFMPRLLNDGGILRQWVEEAYEDTSDDGRKMKKCKRKLDEKDKIMCSIIRDELLKFKKSEMKYLAKLYAEYIEPKLSGDTFQFYNDVFREIFNDELTNQKLFKTTLMEYKLSR